MPPSRVTLVEVGPRDGLQNEAAPVSTADKIELIHRLASTGLTVIEAGSFVSPRWVPQMADTAEVLAALDFNGPVRYPVLTPNLHGFDAARAAGVRDIAVFAAASEAFSRRNINCSIAESLERFQPVVEAARTAGIRVRGYVSCVLGCPYQSEVAPEAVADVAARLSNMGCEQISLGDTIGRGTPEATRRLIGTVAARVPMERLAGHFHDTWGMAAANVYAAWREGVATFDASVGGLGGCPYARGASGNVATEDLVHLFAGLGVDTGVDLVSLVETAVFICERLGRSPVSKVAKAVLASQAYDVRE